MTKTSMTPGDSGCRLRTVPNVCASCLLLSFRLLALTCTLKDKGACISRMTVQSNVLMIYAHKLSKQKTWTDVPYHSTQESRDTKRSVVSVNCHHVQHQGGWPTNSPIKKCRPRTFGSIPVASACDHSFRDTALSNQTSWQGSQTYWVRISVYS